MRSVKFAASEETEPAWAVAARLTAAYLAGNTTATRLLSQLPEGFRGGRRAACQSLFLGALRHGHRVRAALAPLLRKAPAPAPEAALLVAGHELIEAPASKGPKIVHHAVERVKLWLSPAEAGFVNALLRRLPEALDAQEPERDPAAWYSHPGWLVARWEAAFGPAATRRLLEWNQGLPETYLRVYRPEDVPPGLRASEWPGFYPIDAAALQGPAVTEALAGGRAYVKDPSTRHAAEVLRPRPGDRVLDLCAAPGGKAVDLARTMQGRGTLVAVDLPGPRIARLAENLGRLAGDDLSVSVVERDVLELEPATFAERGLPAAYDAVLLDAPCSNTGVIRRRTDVKWRLRPGDVERAARLQYQLLHSAARFVRPGGRLAYGTCSIEAEENEGVVEAFLRSRSGAAFALVEHRRGLPWECRHDGVGVYALRRT